MLIRAAIINLLNDTESQGVEHNVVIIVRRKSDLPRLINEGQYLRNDKTALGDLIVPGPSDALWPYFDGIRIINTGSMKSM